MARFPLFIDISSMTCLVFGGGKVALRKIETLLKYDARIQVVSAAVDPRFVGLLPADRIHLLDIKVPGEEMQKTGYSEKMQGENSPEYWLENADLVIASTNDRGVNHYIATLCKERGIPVNVIDAPEECSFLFPSIVKKGEISIGINTSMTTSMETETGARMAFFLYSRMLFISLLIIQGPPAGQRFAVLNRK